MTRTVTRSDILENYIEATHGLPVGDDSNWGGPQSPALANDWLQYITGRNLVVPGNAIDWLRATAADAEPDKPNQVIEALTSVATFYPAVVHRRALAVPPQPADLIVFRVRGTDHGTLGLYLDHDRHGWTVYTQGSLSTYLPAERFYLSSKLNQALGWWRVRPECIHAAHGFTHDWQVPA